MMRRMLKFPFAGLRLMQEFSVKFSGPLDLRASLEWYSRWGDDLVAGWDGRVLAQTARVKSRSIPFLCRVSGTRSQPAFKITVRAQQHIAPIQSQVARMFLTAPRSFTRLVNSDPVIARLANRFPGLRPVLQLDPFTSLVRSISAQQVNLKWALTTRNRLAQAFGVRHRINGRLVYSLEPARIAATDLSDIRELQFTQNKSKSIKAVARAVVEGELNFDRIAGLDDALVTEELTKLHGIGVWTAEWFLARTLGRPRVVAGDLGVRKAVGQAYRNGRLPSEQEVRAITAHWGTAAGVAQQLLLHALSHNAL